MPRSQVPSVLDKAVSSLQFSDVAMGEKLGEGTSGVVYVAQRLKQEGGGEEKGCSGGKKVAVKIFKDASSDGRPMDEVSGGGFFCMMPSAPHAQCLCERALTYLPRKESNPSYTHIHAHAPVCTHYALTLIAATLYRLLPPLA